MGEKGGEMQEFVPFNERPKMTIAEIRQYMESKEEGKNTPPHGKRLKNYNDKVRARRKRMKHPREASS